KRDPRDAVRHLRDGVELDRDLRVRNRRPRPQGLKATSVRLEPDTSSSLHSVRLFLVRHAEAAPGDPDDLRPLTPAGREQARKLGATLATEQPEVVLTSP